MGSNSMLTSVAPMLHDPWNERWPNQHTQPRPGDREGSLPGSPVESRAAHSPDDRLRGGCLQGAARVVRLVHSVERPGDLYFVSNFLYTIPDNSNESHDASSRVEKGKC